MFEHIQKLFNWNFGKVLKAFSIRASGTRNRFSRSSCRLSDGLRQLWDWTLGVRAFGAQKYLCVLLKVDWPFYSRFKFALHPPLHFLRSIILASFRFHAQWKKMLRQWARVSLVFQIAQRSSVLKICVCSEMFLDVVIFWDLSIIVKLFISKTYSKVTISTVNFKNCRRLWKMPAVGGTRQ